MTDHRRRAEELGRYFDWEKDTEQVREIASALKEVEEETFARAVERVEKKRGVFVSPDDKEKELGWFNAGIECAITALREEAAKK